MKTYLTILLAFLAALSGAQLSPPSGGTPVDILSPDVNASGAGSQTHQINEYHTVTHGSTTTIVNSSGFTSDQYVNRSFSGPGYVGSFSLQIAGASSDNTCTSGSTLTVVVDGATTHSVNLLNYWGAHYKAGGDVSTPSFFNKYFWLNAAKTSAGQMSMGTVLPVPFTSSISISITNGSSSNSMTFFSMASIVTGVPNTWPGTRKLWAFETDITSSTTANVTQQYLNFAPLVPGRYFGDQWLDDGFPGSVSGNYQDEEGDYNLYLDCFNWVWAAGGTVVAGSSPTIIMDPDGNKETCTTPGIVGATIPSFTATAPGGTTPDGTAVWTKTLGDATTVRQNSHTYIATVHRFIDSNGNMQLVTTGGTAASNAPVWATTNGATTNDGTMVCTCYTNFQRAAIRSSGTEDWFALGFNFSSLAVTGSGVFPYLPAHNDAGGVNFYATQTVGAFRFRLGSDAVRFKSAVALFRQNGDTSETSFTGYPEIWNMEYVYTD